MEVFMKLILSPRLFVLLSLFVLLAGCAAPANPEPTVPESTAPEPVATVSEFATFEPRGGGKTFYVSGEGNDSNNGLSKNNPFRTLQKAADLTQPGDTVLVMNGTYTKTLEDKQSEDNSVLRITRSGTAKRYIIYRAMDGHTPKIFVDFNYAGIRVNASYIVIDGFTVEGNLPNLSFEEANALARGTDEAAALQNYKYNSNGIGSFPDAENPATIHHLIFRNNTVFNHPGGGIFSNGSDYVRIENNTVYNNSYYSAYANSGISFYKSTAIDNKTDFKMFIRNNKIFKNENKVPFWFSNTTNPAQRVITDGNGIIIDDSRNTQGTPNIVYTGKFLINNNVVFDNGGRGINVFSSNGVVARNNTTFENGRTPGFTEIAVGDADDVKFIENIFVSRPDREPILEFNATNVVFERNLFEVGSETPGVPGSTNLIKNGDFATDLSNWNLVVNPSAGFAQNTRDEFGRSCIYVDQPNLPNSFDIYLAQGGLTIKQGASYTLSFNVATSNKTKADFVVKVGGSAAPFNTYFAQTESLPVNSSDTYSRTFTFNMTSPTDSAAQLEFQVAGNPEATYICFDNIVLTESGGGNLVVQDAGFVYASTNPAVADFRLKSNSLAIGAASTNVGSLSSQKTASNLGAY
jgi:parallel beta-helix repeat protein